MVLENRDYGTVSDFYSGWSTSPPSLTDVLDGATDVVDSGTYNFLTVDPGALWFETEHTLTSTPVAWLAVWVDQRSTAIDRQAFWQIVDVRAKATDDTEVRVPFRHINMVPIDEDVFWQAAGMRVARSVDGESLYQFETDHGGPLTITVRMALVQGPDTDNPAVQTQAEVQTIAVHSVPMPEPTSTVEWSGPEWAPKVTITDTATTPGPETPRAGRATITDPDGNVVASGLFTWNSGVLEWQYPSILEPGKAHTLACTVEYDDFATIRRTHTPATTPAEPSVGSAGTLNVAASGRKVTITYPHENARIERAAAWDRNGDVTSWATVWAGGDGTADPGSVVDYPPLNTPLTYRAWHGTDGTPGEGFDSGSDLSAISTETTELGGNRWFVLTDPDSDDEFLIRTKNVTASRESTTSRTVGGEGATLHKGVVTSPEWAVTAPILSTSERGTLDRLFAADRLVWRSPAGERYDVAVIGAIRTTDMPAESQPDPSIQPGTEGESSPRDYMAETRFTLAVDSRQP